MSNRRRLFYLLSIMAAVSMVVGITTIRLLYDAAFEQQRSRLVEMAKGQARLIEAMARFGNRNPRAALKQMVEARSTYEGFGETGELTLGYRREDSIHFLLKHRHYDFDQPKPIPFESDLGEPMRQALLGRSGTLVGLDYRGEVVLAAHEPVAELNWGLVTKIDLTEIRAPFVRAGLIAGCAGLLAVAVGSFLFLRVTSPLLRRLEETEARTRTIVETAVDAIITIGEDGVIQSFNKAAERTFGYSAREVVGQNVSLLMPPPYKQEHDGYLRNYLKTGERKIIGIGREVVGLRKDGTRFPIDVAVSEVRLGKLRSFTGIVRDITERKRAEEQLAKMRENESLVRLGEMAAVVAHEIKNPLAAISGAIQVIGSQLPPDSTYKSIINEILQRVDGLSNTVNDLLFFARPRSPHLASLPIRVLLEETVSLILQDPDLHDVEADLSGADVLVRGDVELLKPVFLNLFVNAAQAMGGAGKISVDIRNTGERCRVAINDTGPGIPSEIQGKIFEPFFTTKSHGTGLGLPTAKRIVEAHEGDIAVQCPPEGGTRVVVQLPLDDGQDEGPSQQEERP